MPLLTRGKEKFNEGHTEGLNEGIVRSLVSLVNDDIISMTEAIKRSGLSEEEFNNLKLKLGL